MHAIVGESNPLGSMDLDEYTIPLQSRRGEVETYETRVLGQGIKQGWHLIGL